jgi:hypothetical protein
MKNNPTTLIGIIVIILLVIIIVMQVRNTAPRPMVTPVTNPDLLNDGEAGIPSAPTNETSMPTHLVDDTPARPPIVRMGEKAQEVDVEAPMPGDEIAPTFNARITAPPGWIFEGDTGVFVYALVNGERVEIGRGSIWAGAEWMSGNPVVAEGPMTYTNTTGSTEGIVVFPAHYGEGDNLTLQEVIVPVVLQ